MYNVVYKLSRAVTAQILRKDLIGWSFDDKPMDSVQDIFNISLVKSLREMNVINEELTEKIIKRIELILPQYGELCEVAIISLKNMLVGYIDYLIEEYKYIVMYKYLLELKGK